MSNQRVNCLGVERPLAVPVPTRRRGATLALAWALVGCAGSSTKLASDKPPSASTANGAPAPAIAAGPRTTKARSGLHQLKSSSGRPYSLFEYEVPTPDGVPHIIAIDGKDEVWFSESGGFFAKNFINVPPMNKIGRLDAGGTVTEWTTGPEPSSPMGIVFDRGGDLWVAERLTNRVSRWRRDGSVVRYDLPTKESWPTGIALDSAGNAWVTQTMGDKAARIDARTGEVREFPFGTKGARATGIAVDQKDRVWVAMRDASALGRLDPASGVFTTIKVPTADAKPCGIMVDDKGRVWFSERNGGKLGRVTEDDTIQEFATDSRLGGPFLMVADRRGDVWFGELFSNRIGRFNPDGKTFEYFPLPSDKAQPAGLAVDSKGNVWVAQQGSNKIGVIVRTELAYIGDGPTAGTRTASLSKPPAHQIVEMDVPTAQSLPGIVAVDRDDTVWFTEMGGGWVSPGFPPGPGGSKIGYVKNGQMGEIATPTPESGPTSMALDPCGGDVWVSLRTANKLARIRDFKIEEVDIPVPNGLPVGVAVDHDHNVWVALSDANKIGRRTPEGEWRFFDLAEKKAEPRTIYVDAKNEIWFAEKTGNRIGHLDQKTWTAKTWELPTRLGWPLSLMEDKHGNIWFAEMRSDKLAYFDPKTEKITEYSLPVQSAPFKVNYVAETDTMWVSTVFSNAILKFDLKTRGVVSVFKVPAEGAWIGGLDRDRAGCLWFSEQFANKLARLCFPGEAPRPTTASVTTSSSASPTCRGPAARRGPVR